MPSSGRWDEMNNAMLVAVGTRTLNGETRAAEMIRRATAGQKGHVIMQLAPRSYRPECPNLSPETSPEVLSICPNKYPDEYPYTCPKLCSAEYPQDRG